MIWTVYYIQKQSIKNVGYAPLCVSSKKIGTFMGGNCKEVIKKTCKKIGYPMRFDKDRYDPGSNKYEYETKDPESLITSIHCIEIAPVGEMIEIDI